MPATIYLDPDDVLGSIKAKIEQTGDDVLTLVAPYGLRALHNPVTLRLLRRYLDASGLRAVLVSRDPSMLDLARAEGLRTKGTDVKQPAALAPDVVRSARAYEAFRRVDAARRRSAAIATLLAVALVLAVPLALALVVLPTATIVIYPQTEPVKSTVEVTASSLVTRPDVANLMIPGQVLQVDFEAEETQSLRGSLRPAIAARGQVMLSNRTDAPITVAAGTRVGSADGTLFSTQAQVIVPPAPSPGAPAAIVAVQGGRSGNKASGTIDRVLDPVLGGQLAVTNLSPTSGGQDAVTPTVSQETYRALREQALQSAREDATARLQQLRPADASFYNESVVLRVAEEDVEPPLGSEATEVTVRVRGNAHVVAFKGEDVNALLRLYAAGKAGEGVGLGDAFSSAPLELVRFDNDLVSFHMQFQTELTPRIDDEQVKNLARGKPAREAEALLAARLPLVGQPTIETAPFWVNSVPSFLWRIRVERGPVSTTSGVNW